MTNGGKIYKKYYNYVWIDRAKWVIAGLRFCCSYECVEDRAFSDIWIPHQPGRAVKMADANFIYDGFVE